MLPSSSTEPRLIQAGPNHRGQRVSRNRLLAAGIEAGRALSALEAVGGHVEGEAAPSDGQHVRPAKVHLKTGGSKPIDFWFYKYGCNDLNKAFMKPGSRTTY